MSNQEMQHFHERALPRLRKVFLHYCRLLDADTKGSAHTMSLREFLHLLVDSGLYQPDQSQRRSGDVNLKVGLRHSTAHKSLP